MNSEHFAMGTSTVFLDDSRGRGIVSKKVLVIEDDLEVVELLRRPIAELGFAMTHEGSGTGGLDRAFEEEFDLLVLDIMLPEMEGVDVLKALREQGNHVPTIMLTSLDDRVRKVMLLELGADDYITKPFDDLEFKARIKAVLRRTGRQKAAVQQSQDRLTVEELEIDFVKRQVKRDGAPIELTAREFDILSVLASHPGRPFSRDELNEAVYGYEVSGYDQSIYTHINRLRGKLEPNPSKPKFVLTVRGVGYAFLDLD